MRDNSLKFAFLIGCMSVVWFIVLYLNIDEISLYSGNAFFSSFLIIVGILFLFFVNKKVYTFARIENEFGFGVKGWRRKKTVEKLLLLLETIFTLAALAIILQYLLNIVPKAPMITLKYYGFIVFLLVLIRCNKKYSSFITSTLGSMVFLLSIVAFIILGYLGHEAAFNESIKNEVFTFAKEEDYNKCKELYNRHSNAYVLLQYGNNTAYVRGLKNDLNEVKFFDNTNEYDEFIDKNTLGKEFYVPVLSGDCTFDDTKLTVKYESDSDLGDYNTGFQNYIEKNIRIYFYFEISILLISFMLLEVIKRIFLNLKKEI